MDIKKRYKEKGHIKQYNTLESLKDEKSKINYQVLEIYLIG
jgi:hypothetical protein